MKLSRRRPACSNASLRSFNARSTFTLAVMSEKVNKVEPSGRGAVVQVRTLPSFRSMRIERPCRSSVKPVASPRTRFHTCSFSYKALAAWMTSSIWGSWASNSLGSDQIWLKEGLNSFSRPLVPNTATASVNVSTVSVCTRIADLKRLSRLSFSVRSSKR